MRETEETGKENQEKAERFHGDSFICWYDQKEGEGRQKYYACLMSIYIEEEYAKKLERKLSKAKIVDLGKLLLGFDWVEKK